jgi:hypothetical protein
MKPGDRILLKYGNGTQAAIVTGVRRGGGLNVKRLYGYGTGHPCLEAAKLNIDDSRILGLLPITDPRHKALVK